MQATFRLRASPTLAVTIGKAEIELASAQPPTAAMPA